MFITNVLNNKIFSAMLSLVCYIGLSLAVSVVVGKPAIFIIGSIATIIGVLWWYATEPKPMEVAAPTNDDYINQHLAFINRYSDKVEPDSFLGQVIHQSKLDVDMVNRGIIDQAELLNRSNLYIRIFSCYDQVTYELSKGIKRLLPNQSVDDYLRSMFNTSFNRIIILNP